MTQIALKQVLLMVVLSDADFRCSQTVSAVFCHIGAKCVDACVNPCTIYVFSGRCGVENASQRENIMQIVQLFVRLAGLDHMLYN